MENRHYRIVGLPGDCIGPEVYASAAQALEVLAGVHGFAYELDEQLIGGAAVDATGYREIALLSLSTSDYPRLDELLARLTEKFTPQSPATGKTTGSVASASRRAAASGSVPCTL